MDNPFLSHDHFPNFAAMTPELADAAMPVLLDGANKGIDAIEANPPKDWDGLIGGIDEATHPLTHAYGLIGHFNSVCNSQAWRDVEAKYQPQMVVFSLRVAQSRPLYEAMKKLLAETNDPTRRRILEKSIRGFEDSGIALEGEKRERFNAIQAELAKLSTDFSNCVLDATKAFKLSVEEAELEGLPSQIKSMLAKDGERFVLTIEDAVYVPAMKHLKSSAIREKLYRARATRAPENEKRITEILALRAENAALLGYAAYSELSVAGKCAPSVEAVEKMIFDMAAVAKGVAAKEDAELEAFAGEKLAPWDRSYWAERLREKRYSYSEEELSKYFDFATVKKGMFDLANRLFGITVEQANGEVPVWHPDVEFYRVTDGGKTIAHFYLDPYSRPETKSGGAWMNEFATREVKKDGSVELPLALLVCNQALPDEKGRALMNFREVETIFHEFGHSLQHMLTTVNDSGASGLNLIDWDAVELASQFMENWCYDLPTVRSFAHHAETGEDIPEELLAKVRAARNYRAASAAMRQLAFARLDLELHSSSNVNPNGLKKAIFDEYMPGVTIEGDRFLESFTHIFSGGYAAGYYSYKWSEVMSADAFGAFEEVGLDDEAAVRATGRRYRDTILACGGSRDPMETFKAFRGRLPTSDALLRQTGLKA